MKDALLAPFLLLGLIGLAYLPGRFLVAPLSSRLSVGERTVFALALGLGAVGYLVLALGLLGIVNSAVYAGLLIVGVGGLVWLGKDLAAAGPLTLPRGPIALACTVALVLIGVCTFVAALAPPAGLEWDSLSYHLAAPKVWQRMGRIAYLPWDHHSNFPFTVEMLYLLLHPLGGASAAKLAHWLCGALLVGSVVMIRGVGSGDSGVGGKSRNTGGLIAGVILASTPIVLWEATTAYIDLGTALFSWLSLYGLIVALRPQESGSNTPLPTPYSLLPSALLMGFALGTKYTVLGFWGMVLVGVFVTEVVREKRLTGAIIGRVALWGIVALAIGAPWYIKNVINTGNPVYPFAYEIFGGKYWSTENARQYADEQAHFGLGKDTVNLLLAPWNVTMEAGLPVPSGRKFIYTEMGVFALSPVYVALLLIAPFYSRRLSALSRACLLYGLGVVLFWFFVMQQTRYLIPALPAFAIVASEILYLLCAGRQRITQFVGGALVGASALWCLYLSSALAFTGMLGYPPAVSVLTGSRSIPSYVNATFELGGACDWINANTPVDSKVALFEVRGYYLDRDYLWAQPDHAAGLLPWDDYKDVDDWLADFKKRGFTTLLVAVPDKDDGRRWRTLLADAIAQGKVQLVYQNSNPRFSYVCVYRIP